MICHELKTIFVHIPKTAGVSLTHAIISHVVGYDTSGEIGHLSQGLKFKFDLRGPQKHKQAMYYVPSYISQKLWDKYYKFAFVRNPWDRAVSEFHWRHQLPTRHPSKDFKQFLKYCESRIQDEKNRRRDIYWTHAQTQKSYVTKKGKVILDDVFKFEDMDRAIEQIQDRIGIPFDLKMYNTSKHKHYQDYYDDESRKTVNRLYRDDIELFEYEF